MSHAADPNKRTDKCGDPFPDVCIPTTVRTPICYLTPALQAAGVTCGIPGLKVVNVAANCAGTFVNITDLNDVVVPSAFEVPCPVNQQFGAGGF